jgi:hypothetical protein
VAFLCALAISLLMILPRWVELWTPRWLSRALAIGLLWVLAAVQGVGLFLAPVGLCAGVAIYAAGRRRGLRRPLAARLGLLCGVLMVSSWLIEGVAGVILRLQTRPPALPRGLPRSGEGVIALAVIGESSARGEPYQDWVSMPRLVAWQLERMRPGIKVSVADLAVGGICLEQAILMLYRLEVKPDVLIVYSGHNEFQARYGWSRHVRYYREESPHRPWGDEFLERGADVSKALRLIRHTIDLQRVPVGPPPEVTRGLVDRPVCSSEEYAFLRQDYERRLSDLLDWCRSEGILPIVVVPPGNEGDYPPVRSMLGRNVPLMERESFGESFHAARMREQTDPGGARRIYEQLLGRHPEFAELHYRLGKLLVNAGEARAAVEHFIISRDRDGLPLRMPSDFQEIVRREGRRGGAIVVDGPRVFRSRSATGILGNDWFHDAHHPNLRGYAALAEEALAGLIARRAAGLTGQERAPEIDLREVANTFGLDAAAWAQVCEKSANFFARTAYTRYDPSESLSWGGRFMDAARAIRAGTPPEATGLPGIGVEMNTASGMTPAETGR